jgi:hypothetical protein
MGFNTQSRPVRAAGVRFSAGLALRSEGERESRSAMALIALMTLAIMSVVAATRLLHADSLITGLADLAR